jgi:hypothetical protein
MRLSKEQAEQHLRAGRPVAFRPTEGGRGKTLRAEPGRRTKGAVAKGFPAVDAEGNDAPGEYLLLRDERGDLTRAGMEQAIREGGSVMWRGDVIEFMDDLPPEEELVAGNAEAAAALRRSLEAQAMEVGQRLARLEVEERKMADPKTDVPTPAVPTGSPPHPQPPQTAPPAPQQPAHTPHQPSTPPVRHTPHTPPQTPDDVDTDGGDDEGKTGTRKKKG